MTILRREQMILALLGVGVFTVGLRCTAGGEAQPSRRPAAPGRGGLILQQAARGAFVCYSHEALIAFAIDVCRQ